MSGYPKARWSVSGKSVGASVWTRRLKEGEGGGYYLYVWKRGAETVELTERVQGTTQDERQWPVNKRSVYVACGTLSVPPAARERDVRDQERAVATLIYADMRKRFGEIAEWIPYDNSGKAVWFHKEVTEGN